MDLREVRQDVMTYVGSLQVGGQPYGCYRLTPGGAAEIYATCDVAIMRTVMGEDLKRSLSALQRQEWIDYVNSYAQEDGS